MPNPLAYNSSTTPTGTFKRSNISYGLMPTNYGIGYGSLSWYNSLDTTSKYVIVSDTYTLGFSTQGNAKPVMWSTGNTSNQNLINLINGMPGNTTNFTDYYDAVNWLQGTNKFLLLNNGYENIVTNGLVLNLDAAWWNSYPTSATTWTDLSGNNLNGTLTNGPTFNSANGGSIVFDGIDDYVTTTSNMGISGANPRTVECWIYVDSFANKSILGYGGQGSGVLFDTMIFFNNGNYLQAIGHYYGGFYDTISTLPNRNTINISQWNQIVHMYDGTTASLYTNGVFSNSKEFSVSTGNQLNTTNNTFLIGTGQYTGAYTYTTGKMSISRMYNRVLTASEVLQNYNAQKSRFGL